MNLLFISKLSQLNILRSSFSFLLNIFNELFTISFVTFTPNFSGESSAKVIQFLEPQK